MLQDLDQREKQYDGRERLDVYASNDDSEPALSNVLTFVATSKNVHWLGPASMESVAQQIAAATGPSGPNYEYLERLAEALWKVSTCSGSIIVSVDLSSLLFSGCRCGWRHKYSLLYWFAISRHCCKHGFRLLHRQLHAAQSMSTNAFAGQQCNAKHTGS